MFEFRIKEIMPHVYHLHFSSHYELAMSFLRFEEYYESENEKYRKQIFSLDDYMEWYAKTHGEGVFTYPEDWGGFNVPSWALLGVRRQENRIPDVNKHDRRMFMLIDWIADREDQSFYFIGTSEECIDGDHKDTLDHEIAHALYTVNKEYMKEVQALLQDWEAGENHKKKDLSKARQILKDVGYHSSTVDDEINAYCSTGLCEELEEVISKKKMKPFQKLFKEYKKKCLSEKSK
ncbi:MAG: hypothetical protein GF334_03290 [Candidatus Altiarchaeales archaeon]|nr:hypothetical protein [Candidatus Altiarchaeales archaeon]